MEKQIIKLHRTESSNFAINSTVLNCAEICLEDFSDNIHLYDIVHGYDIHNITASPVKRIKIGNGSQQYNELKSIIILDNADFIIVDKDGYIIDYITNAGLISATILANNYK